MKQLVNGSVAMAEGLIARGRLHERVFEDNDRSISKYKDKNKSYKYYKKNGHVIDDCYKFQNKNKVVADQKEKQPTKFDQVSVVEDDQSDSEILTIFYGDFNPSKE